jgi:AcrR family transcriptional regulator
VASISERTQPEGSGSRSRAAALPAEERRALIVEATKPLVLEHGSAVTTRQIAEAAGIAEGTIFRVFPDKESLVDAVIESVTDAAPLEAALGDIDATLPLNERLLEAVQILRRRVAAIFQLTAALGTKPGPVGSAGPPNRGPVPSAALAALFEADRDQIRREPAQAAQLLRGLTIASTHPALTGDEPLDSAEIVSLLLDGLRAHPQDPTC